MEGAEHHMNRQPGQGQPTRPVAAEEQEAAASETIQEDEAIDE